MIGRGVGLLTDTDAVEQLPKDPGGEYYFKPGPMPEKQLGEPIPFISVNETYRRFTLRDDSQIVGVFYARSDPGPGDKLRLINDMYSGYGRD